MKFFLKLIKGVGFLLSEYLINKESDQVKWAILAFFLIKTRFNLNPPQCDKQFSVHSGSHLTNTVGWPLLFFRIWAQSEWIDFYFF